MPEERKLVTVLFADITGSTTIGLQHDPEVVRGTIARTFASLSDVLRAYGGTIEKFVGDEIMAVFGVPVAHGDDAERAVRAALACRQRIDALNAHARIPLELHSGINTGEVVADTARADQFLATGTAINVGSRLMHGARPGEILVGALTRELTGTAIVYGEARAIEAKNVGVIPAWPVHDARAEASAAFAGGRVRAPLVGRDRELAHFLDAFTRVQRSRAPELLVIDGAAGIGKSRLVREFAALVGRDRVLVAPCRPYGEDSAVEPVRQMLRADIGITPHDDRASAMRATQERVAALAVDPTAAGALAARLAAAIGLIEPADALPTVARAEIAGELRRAVRRYVELVAARRGCAVIFEDVHWASDPVFELIAELRNSSRTAVLTVCVGRRDEGLPPQLAALAAPDDRIALGPLSADCTRDLIRALIDDTMLPPDRESELIGRAEGNPLYVEEFLRMVLEADGSMTGHGPSREEMGPSIPASLHALIAARLDAVPADVKALLHRASVLGETFSVRAIEALGMQPLPVNAVEEAIIRDLLVSSREAVPGGGQAYRFKHGLIRDVAYMTVPKSERAALHDRHCQWLERISGDRRGEIVELLAFHAERAFILARDVESEAAQTMGVRAIELLISAAAHARRQQDAGAIRLYERALAVASLCDPPAAARADAVAGAATCRYWRDGDRTGLAPALAAYAGLPPTETKVGLLLAHAFAAMADGRPDLYIPVLDHAVAEARATADANLIAEALGVAANAAYQSGDARRYVELVDGALAYARAHSASRQLPRLLMLRHIMATRQAQFTLALSLEDECERVRAGLPLPSIDITWLARRAALRHAMRSDEEATAIAERALVAAREHASRIVIGLLFWQLGDALFGRGEWLRARGAFLEAMAIFAGLRQRGQIPEVAARCARARVRLGDLAGASADLEVAQTSVIASDIESFAIMAVARAELAFASGDRDDGDASFEQAIATLAPTIYIAPLAATRVAYARSLIDSGRFGPAGEQLRCARLLYADPAADRCRVEIDELLESCVRAGSA
ncbi:MAG TPA: adenylate/guanylate cyclase domain-containing protein [Candidatus Limnocylindria bacterium]